MKKRLDEKLVQNLNVNITSIINRSYTCTNEENKCFEFVLNEKVFMIYLINNEYFLTELKLEGSFFNECDILDKVTIEEIKAYLNKDMIIGGNKMISIILCFASYEDKKGMYKNISVNLEDFCKESIEAELIKYYKNINVEEFFLADAWTDDNDTINNIIVKNYTECYQSYFDFLEGLKENLEDINLECFEIACYQNFNCRDINYLIKYSENINIIDSIWDYFEECVNVENSELATNLFQMNNETEAIEDLRRLGYDLCEYNEMIFEDNN